MEFMLYANGFSVADVRVAIGCFNRCLGRDVASDEIRIWPEYSELKSVLAAHEMPALRVVEGIEMCS